jgi:hypothetical protein
LADPQLELIVATAAQVLHARAASKPSMPACGKKSIWTA